MGELRDDARKLPDFHVNGGDDDSYSYSRNSYYQKIAANVVKEKIEMAILTKLDPTTFSSQSNTICITDLGCAAGPNTFNAIHEILQIIKTKYQSRPLPEFQVFFNDRSSNDFNTLFSSLPTNKQYFAAGVPGSFYEQLFPNDSIHFAHCSYALHWLSKIPDELLDESSCGWNKGRIHYTNAGNGVVEAYASQFGRDMEKFIECRGKEIVSGGMMVIIMPGIPHRMPYSKLAAGVMYDVLGSILMDMAKQELISEEEVNSFNLPIYAPSPEEMREIVERNGEFYIETMELNDPAPWLKEEGSSIDVPKWVTHVRVAMESMFTKHFTIHITHHIFTTLVHKLLQLSHHLDSCYREKTQLFVVLIRK